LVVVRVGREVRVPRMAPPPRVGGAGRSRLLSHQQQTTHQARRTQHHPLREPRIRSRLRSSQSLQGWRHLTSSINSSSSSRACLLPSQAGRQGEAGEPSQAQQEEQTELLHLQETREVVLVRKVQQRKRRSRVA
jgi:hypothetical protein